MNSSTPAILMVLLLFVTGAGAAVVVPDSAEQAGEIPGWYLGFGTREAAFDAEAVRQRLASQRMEDEWRAALSEAERRAQANPGDPEAQAAVGDWYFLLNRLDEAAHHYWRAARLDASNPSVLESFGFVMLAMGDHKNGLRVLDRLLEIAPAHQRARFNRAAALTRLERHDAAIEAWVAYIREYPGEWRAAYNLGLAYHQAGRNREAIRFLDTVQRSQPVRPYVLAAVIRVLNAVSGNVAQIDALTERLTRLIGRDAAERLIREDELPVFLKR